MTEPAWESDRRARPTWQRILGGVLTIAVVGAIFIGVLPAIAEYDEVWATIRALSWGEALSVLAVGLWNLATYWFLMTAVLPGLTLGRAAVVNQASTAVSNTMPAGGALGVGVSYAMYRSWGFRTESFVLATVVSGVWNTFVKLGLPVVAVALVVISGSTSPALVAASTIGVGALIGSVAVFALMLRREAIAGAVGEFVARSVNRLRALVKRPPVTGWGESAVAFSRRTSALVRGRWQWITFTAIVSHLSLYVLLLVTLRAVGVSESDVSWVTVLAAFAFVRLISALPITPGGVGVVELGYAAAIGIGLDDPTRARVVAAVLFFRFITYALPIPLGAAAYVVWRRKSSWRVAGQPRP